jgi:hypothetical protein
MKPVDRLEFVNSKYICRNCIVTSTHRAYDCVIKAPCGYKVQNEICLRKHHISLHKAFSSNGSSSHYNKNSSSRDGNAYKRNNSKFNQQRAEEIMKESENEETKSLDSDDDEKES